MKHARTAAVVTLLVLPVVAGGFFLQTPRPQASGRLLGEVLELVQTRYVDSMPLDAAYEKAARGLVHELRDPYSEVLSPVQSADFNRTVGGRYGGTGMLLGSSASGAVVVDRVFPNTPAEEGGVREGDHIIGVDSVTSGLTLDGVSVLLRGEPGTPVSVTYARPGVAVPIKLKFIRRVVHIPAVEYATLLGDHIGYIPLQTFNENAAEEVETAVGDLVKQGAKGLVLDMRDNGGGIVEQALETSSLFLKDSQPIASVRSRAEETETLRSSGKHLALDIPLVVLLDGGSASATEIVAGALQDHDRALVLGTVSFGKGLVQSIFKLQNGYQLKLTTGKWFTPSGRSIHRARRLLPDGEFVEVPPDSMGDTLPKPLYRSDAGRTLVGGGGIRPDLVVPDDTLSTVERQVLRALAPKAQIVARTLQDYAFELKGSVKPGFTVPAVWSTELMRRLHAADATVDPELEGAARTYLTSQLADLVARNSLGSAAAKARALSEDHQLTRAVDLLEHNKTQAQLFAAAPHEQPAPSKH